MNQLVQRRRSVGAASLAMPFGASPAFMKYQYYICDVFTETRFGGNQLAVLPKADGLSDHQMQQITREFNFSESTFVFPAKAGTHVTFEFLLRRRKYRLPDIRTSEPHSFWPCR